MDILIVIESGIAWSIHTLHVYYSSPLHPHTRPSVKSPLVTRFFHYMQASAAITIHAKQSNYKSTCTSVHVYMLTAVSPSLSWIPMSAPLSTNFWTHFLCLKGKAHKLHYKILIERVYNNSRLHAIVSLSLCIHIHDMAMYVIREKRLCVCVHNTDIDSLIHHKLTHYELPSAKVLFQFYPLR